ncbi:MAG: hypothetical protein ABIH63_01585 [archaeon]
MIYTDEHAKAIFGITKKKFWSIYKAKDAKFILPSSLSRLLLKEPKFGFNTPYILLPHTILFSNQEKLEEKIRTRVEKEKPTVEFLPTDKDRHRQVLKNFILNENTLTLKLSKEGDQVVSYRHFIESILPSLPRLYHEVAFTAP